MGQFGLNPFAPSHLQVKAEKQKQRKDAVGDLMEKVRQQREQAAAMKAERLARQQARLAAETQEEAQREALRQATRGFNLAEPAHTSGDTSSREVHEEGLHSLIAAGHSAHEEARRQQALLQLQSPAVQQALLYKHSTLEPAAVQSLLQSQPTSTVPSPRPEADAASAGSRPSGTGSADVTMSGRESFDRRHAARASLEGAPHQGLSAGRSSGESLSRNPPHRFADAPQPARSSNASSATGSGGRHSQHTGGRLAGLDSWTHSVDSSPSAKPPAVPAEAPAAHKGHKSTSQQRETAAAAGKGHGKSKASATAPPPPQQLRDALHQALHSMLQSDEPAGTSSGMTAAASRQAKAGTSAVGAAAAVPKGDKPAARNATSRTKKPAPPPREPSPPPKRHQRDEEERRRLHVSDPGIICADIYTFGAHFMNYLYWTRYQGTTFGPAACTTARYLPAQCHIS